ncbi:efflux RND transporter periplasmic adaptor subunit [Lutispora sp.]|nr:efflux RND transporter periplasmic adaptor subunit [Lutispora sp.]MEA4964188.1 efflux RND transporter periplasmic adaptor subunit [Lutispora sp.]
MRGKKKLIWMGLIIIIISAAAYFALSGGKAVSVNLAKVQRGNIQEYIEEKASVELKNKADIYGLQSGVVTLEAVDVGDRVKTGDVLLKIQDEELLLNIKALELQKQAAEAKLEEARKGISQWDLQKLEAQEKAAQIAYEEAKRVAENNRKLYEAGGISKDIYDSSVAALASAEASLEVIKSSLAAAQEGFSPNIEKQFKAQIDEIQIQINHLKSKQKDYIVKSPIDGIVMLAEAPQGSVVPQGKLIFQVGNYDDMFLTSDILVDDIANVREGSEVLISNKDLGISDVKGAVRKIYPRAFSKMSDLGIAQKRIKAEISFGETVDNLKPGYDMDIKIVTASSQNTLIVNEKAVFEHEGKSYVFINHDGAARMIQIDKGLESDDEIEVLKGLNEGQEVILSPDENIEEGTIIKS